MPPKTNAIATELTALSAVATPSLPLEGREEEFSVIVNYIVDHIEGLRSDILFISGACGCGKTSTLLRVEAWLGQLPSTAKSLRECALGAVDTSIRSLNTPDGRSLPLRVPTSPINLKWCYINCSGLTREAAMDAIWASVSCDAAFAEMLLKHIREMLLAMGGSGTAAKNIPSNKAGGSSAAAGMSQAGETALDVFFRRYSVCANAKQDRVRSKAEKPSVPCKIFKGKYKPFFAFALDEAEFTDPNSYPLLAAFSSAAQEFGNRMSLILISNSRSLSFLPLNVSGRRAVTEVVFQGYSVEALKRACRAHFSEKFLKEGRMFTEMNAEASSTRGRKPNASTQRPLLLDDVLAPSALDYAVKTAVNLHSADLRKAIALCGNAISSASADSTAAPSCPSGATRPAAGGKRPREDEHSVACAPTTSRKVTLQGMLSSIADLQSSLDQICTFPPYTRQLLKCFVDCVKRTNGATYSFMPATLQAELWRKADELRIPKPSAASVIEALEDLRGMGFVAASATSTRSQKMYTLSWSLAELEPRLAAVPGFI